MKKIVLLSILMVAQCFAVSIPKASPGDTRVTYQDFNNDEVTKVYAKDGFVTLIKLQSDERVIDMFTGFADGWEIQDRANFVFVKPRAYISKTDQFVMMPKNPDWNTNLILTTNQRVYVFDLVLVEKQQPLYRVNFDYPADVKQKQEQQMQEEELVKEFYEEVNFVKDKLSNLNNPRNWNFNMKVNPESEEIAPLFAYDDGVFTYLGFDNTKAIPSVFLYDKKNGESILNTSMKEQGEYQILVIHKVAPAMILRAGDKVVGIFNDGYGQNPAPAGTTISKDVTRVIK